METTWILRLTVILLVITAALSAIFIPHGWILSVILGIGGGFLLKRIFTKYLIEKHEQIKKWAQ